MNFIKRFRTWLAYRRCLRKFEDALENMKTCLEGTTVHRSWTNIATHYLDEAIKLKEELDA